MASVAKSFTNVFSETTVGNWHFLYLKMSISLLREVMLILAISARNVKLFTFPKHQMIQQGNKTHLGYRIQQGIH